MMRVICRKGVKSAAPIEQYITQPPAIPTIVRHLCPVVIDLHGVGDQRREIVGSKRAGIGYGVVVTFQKMIAQC